MTIGALARTSTFFHRIICDTDVDDFWRSVYLSHFDLRADLQKETWNPLNEFYSSWRQLYQKNRLYSNWKRVCFTLFFPSEFISRSGTLAGALKVITSYQLENVAL